jgi:CubicO group peptidase (beta-lactamase class C family)
MTDIRALPLRTRSAELYRFSPPGVNRSVHYALAMYPELPSTPAGRQMAWLIDLLASGAMGLHPSEVEEHAAPSLLAQLPSEALANRLQDVSTQMGGMKIARVDETGRDSLSVRVLAYGYGWEVGIAVEPEPPHRLVRIDFGHWSARPPGTTVMPWTPDLAGWGEVEDEHGAPRAEIHALLAAARDRLRLIGLSVEVVHRDHIAYWLESGCANLDPPIPISSFRFMICSISKTMTALGVLQLWERGLLQLDDPVNDHLRAFRIAHPDPAAPAVTIRHLLTHTSGAYASVSLGFETDAPTPSLAELYGGLLACQFPPGSRGSYSDHGFAALGQLIEDVSQRPFVEYMRENIFGPLGMSQFTDFVEREEDAPLATGYGGADGQIWEDWRFQAGPLAPAGSVISNGEDMARYLLALVNGGANEYGRVVRAETLAAALTPQVETAIPGMSMGLGFVLPEVEGRRVAWHNGGWPGFSSTMWFAPNEGWGLVMLTNTSDVTGRGNDLDAVGRELLGMLLSYEAEL